MTLKVKLQDEQSDSKAQKKGLHLAFNTEEPCTITKRIAWGKEMVRALREVSTYPWVPEEEKEEEEIQEERLSRSE